MYEEAPGFRLESRVVTRTQALIRAETRVESAYIQRLILKCHKLLPIASDSSHLRHYVLGVDYDPAESIAFSEGSKSTVYTLSEGGAGQILPSAS